MRGGSVRWVWVRIVEIVTRHDWQLLALFLAALCSAGAPLLMAEDAISVWGAGAVLAMAGILLRATLLGNTYQARAALLGLSIVFGYHAFLPLFVTPAEIATFTMSGTISFGCGLAYLSAGG